MQVAREHSRSPPLWPICLCVRAAGCGDSRSRPPIRDPSCHTASYVHYLKQEDITDTFPECTEPAATSFSDSPLIIGNIGLIPLFPVRTTFISRAKRIKMEFGHACTGHGQVQKTWVRVRVNFFCYRPIIPFLGNSTTLFRRPLLARSTLYNCFTVPKLWDVPYSTVCNSCCKYCTSSLPWRRGKGAWIGQVLQEIVDCGEVSHVHIAFIIELYW